MPEDKKRCRFCKWSTPAMMEQEDVYGETRKYLTHLCYRYTEKPILSTEVCEYYEVKDVEDSVDE